MPTGRLLAGLLLAGLLPLAGCSAEEQSAECPGPDCSRALDELAVDLAEQPGVTAVDRVWQRSGSGQGGAGGIEVHAIVLDEALARRIAERLLDAWVASDAEEVESVSLLVVPSPETGVPQRVETSSVGAIAEADDVPCAPERCTTEAARLEQALGEALEGAPSGGPFAGKVAVDAVRWRAGGPAGPSTTVEATVSDAALSDAALRELRSRLVAAAEAGGASALGDLRTVINYSDRVEFPFQGNGKTGALGMAVTR